MTAAALHKRAEKIGCLLLERGHLNSGDHVALVYPPGIDLICAFYGCLYVGMVPVCVRPPHPQNLQTTLPTVRMIVDVSRSVAILSTASIIRLLKSKEASNRVDVKVRKKFFSFFNPLDFKVRKFFFFFKNGFESNFFSFFFFFFLQAWPTIMDTDDLPRKKLAGIFKPSSMDSIACLDFSVSTTGMLAGIKVSF